MLWYSDQLYDYNCVLPQLNYAIIFKLKFYQIQWSPNDLSDLLKMNERLKAKSWLCCFVFFLIQEF